MRDFLAARFPNPYVGLDAADYRGLIPRLVEIGISGGAAYDALIAATKGGPDLMGLSSETGTLDPGKSADLAVIALPDRSGSRP